MPDSNLPTEINKPSVPSTELRQGQILNAALDNLTQSQKQELMGTAAHEALNLEVEHRQRMARHDSAREAITDHIQTYHSLDKQGRTTRHKVTSDVQTGSGSMKVESKSGAPCFVATIAYGDACHPDVILLRNYRDTVLINHAIGRRFIAWYWRNGPKIAILVGWSHSLRSIARFFIKGIIFFLR